MKCAILLHLYQPFFQEKSVFDTIYNQSYKPLLELIKEKKNVTFTLNVPLSLLELMDKFGYSTWIADLKKLYTSDHIELVGSGAYHPLLSTLPEDIATDSIILNEYGLGYYLGSHTGFDGDPCILLKNINGFFPPELAVNTNLFSLLSSLGYTWCLVDTFAIPEGYDKSVVYRINDIFTSIVVRNSALSNAIAFKRSSSIGDLIALHSEINVIALDGETFGFHNPLGLVMLNNLIQYYEYNNIQLVSLSELVSLQPLKILPHINESTWAMSHVNQREIYFNWINDKSHINNILWKLHQVVVNTYKKLPNTSRDGLSDIISLWNNKDGTKEQLYVILQKMLNSDMFWWSSDRYLPDNIHLYNKDVLIRSLRAYMNLLDLIAPIELLKDIKDMIVTVKNDIVSK